MRFTHMLEMDRMLPGTAPTGMWVGRAILAVVQLEDGPIADEHIYWDQASVLVQLGLLATDELSVAGAESARKLLDPASLPTNGPIRRGWAHGGQVVPMTAPARARVPRVCPNGSPVCGAPAD